MNYTEKISNKLNDVLVKNYDAEKGYINAAKNVESERWKSFFEEQAAMRSEFSKDLRTEILRYGELPENSGTISGSAHRTWMNFKTLFSSNDDEAILNEVIRGEESSLDEYNEVLSERQTLPPSIESLLDRQRKKIEKTISSVKVHEELMS